jgi:phosphomannomutase / phosphoglucomutase
MISPAIFKSYDIRGVVDETLNVDIARCIGQAIGSEARVQGGAAVAIGRDGRLSGPMLSAALAEGLCAAGVDVVDLGSVPTPLGYFATHRVIDGRPVDSCVIVTGSHNPPDYNGFKIVLRGATLYGEQIQALYRRIAAGDFLTGQGCLTTHDITDAYIQKIVGHIKLERPLKLAIDCGNGIAGAIAPRLFKALGCEVYTLFCDVDGHFPNHHPDPARPENLRDLMTLLETSDAQIGFAFDGDGDRLGVVTKAGNIIHPDRQLMLFAQDVLTRYTDAPVVFDVKCSRQLAPWIRAHGGQPLMWKTGHSLIKAKMRETSAPLAGEMSGHLFFKDRWYGFDDGLYAGARLLELLCRCDAPDDPGTILNALPDACSTPELQLHLQEGENSALIQRLQHSACFNGADEIVMIDGLRVEYPDGFGLMRASNTTPAVIFRFEADNEAALARIQDDFRGVLLSHQVNGPLPF